MGYNNEGWAGVYRDVQSQRMLPEGFLVEQILVVCQLLKESWIRPDGPRLSYRLQGLGGRHAFLHHEVRGDDGG